ncbi:MAG: tRNA (adenosine(37)-N6)-threonylcarbamoyltransferase complex dimerization subunit type 1 TsaB [Treponema sp.]|jgi:tRNA threonylcarbamoyladenosine biosynthesis protein TsaB|nr:tRNA (adenosine(37)-N6)-threonylcarbamoyltransferase complex dimerization subunit type 1 TsaB [Treponema sp.]
MNLLAIDSATELLSVAVASGEGRYSFEADAGPRHSALLLEVIDMLLEKAGLRPGDLDGVVCMKGPGSFTGLRVGYAAAKGICMARGIPMAALPTLDCMARPFSFFPGLVMPLIDAKQKSFFTALYRKNVKISGYFDAGIPFLAENMTKAREGAEKVLLTGPGGPMACRDFSGLFPGEIFCSSDRRGYAGNMLEIAMTDGILRGKGEDEFFSGPEYIRKSDAEARAEIIEL